MKRFNKHIIVPSIVVFLLIIEIGLFTTCIIQLDRLQDQQLKMWDAIIDNTKFDIKLIESDGELLEIIKILHPEIPTNIIDETTLELQENKSQIQNHFND